MTQCPWFTWDSPPYSCCSSITIKSALFCSQKSAGLKDSLYRHLGKGGRQEPAEEKCVLIEKKIALFKRKREMKIVQGNVKTAMMRLTRDFNVENS